MTQPTPASSDPASTVLAFVKSHWLALTLLVVAVVFVLQNRGDTRVEFLFFNLTAPLWLTLGATLVAGALIGWGLARRRPAKA